MYLRTCPPSSKSFFFLSCDEEDDSLSSEEEQERGHVSSPFIIHGENRERRKRKVPSSLSHACAYKGMGCRRLTPTLPNLILPLSPPLRRRCRHLRRVAAAAGSLGAFVAPPVLASSPLNLRSSSKGFSRLLRLLFFVAKEGRLGVNVAKSAAEGSRSSWPSLSGITLRIMGLQRRRESKKSLLSSDPWLPTSSFAVAVGFVADVAAVSAVVAYVPLRALPKRPELSVAFQLFFYQRVSSSSYFRDIGNFPRAKLSFNIPILMCNRICSFFQGFSLEFPELQK